MLRETKHALRQAAKRLLTAVTRPIAKVRFRRALAAQHEPVRIHVGAGAIRLNGWVNTDATWRNRLYLDVTRPWPVPAGAVSHVYGDNVIEHFPLPVARRVLSNSFQALAPGGVIRLATPDVERTARVYLDDTATARRHMEFLAAEGFDVTHPVDLLRITFAECGHHVGYLHDFDSLAGELRRAGFVDVCRAETGDSELAAFAGLESRTSESCVATQLVVEARKP